VSEIAVWLAKASESLALDVRKLSSTEGGRISDAAKGRYVRGNPRVWWLDWAVPCEQFDSTTTTLSSVLPVRAGKVWLVPETENEPIVYELDAADLERLLAECPYFEFYVLAHDLSWLVAESDHNVYFVCRAPN
jgi:hypothetical protein